MSFLFILLIACAIVAAAARSIKAVPWAWYVGAIVLDVVYAYGIVYSLPPGVLQVLSAVVQRCLLATALLVIVMYCGVFSEHSAIRKRIRPIRGELSVIACILAFAHCLNYLSSYLEVIGSNIAVLKGNQLTSLVIAIILFALLIVLGATSIKALKHRMKTTTWKSIQRSSYVFFGLIYVHELLILYPSAAKGSGDALAACVAGGIVFASYYVLRIAKYLDDRKRDAASIGETNEEEAGDDVGKRA